MLSNLNEPATPAQIASANAAVAQAELVLTNLIESATPAQIASANAAVAQAELALENLNATATPAQIASANGAVAQAEANLSTARGSVETALASRTIAHQAFCDTESNSLPPVFSYSHPICPVDVVLLSENEKNVLLDMIKDDYLSAQANNLLNTHQGYQSALGSRLSAENSLTDARTNLAEIDEPPTTTQLAQASESLKSAQEQRSALDEPPTVAELAQVLPVRVEHHDTAVVVAVGDQDSAVWQERDILRLTEMILVLTGHVLLAEGLQQAFAVIRKNEDLLAGFVDDPDTALGVVRANADPVRSRSIRAFEQVVPLVPNLDHVTVPVDHIDGVLPRPAVAAEHVDVDRSREVREALRKRVGQKRFAPLEDDDAVRSGRIDTRITAVRETRTLEGDRPVIENLVRDWSGRTRVLGSGLRS